MTSRYNTLITLLFFLLTTSCKELRKSIDDTLRPIPPQNREQGASNTSSSISFSSSTTFSSHEEQHFRSIFDNAETLDSIQQALYNLPGLKGKKLFFMAGLYFYDYQGGMISVGLQDPDIPNNVDTYVYNNGAWEKQQPVKMAGTPHFPLEMLLMPLNELKFSTAKKVYDIAVERSKAIEGAEPVKHIYFSQIKAVHVKEWYVIIQGSRQNHRITFDVDGNIR